MSLNADVHDMLFFMEKFTKVVEGNENKRVTLRMMDCRTNKMLCEYKDFDVNDCYDKYNIPEEILYCGVNWFVFVGNDTIEFWLCTDYMGCD